MRPRRCAGFGAVTTFYKYALIDGVIPANPAMAVSRPKVAWEGQKRTVLHPLEFAALPAAARGLRSERPCAGRLLGMLGLRVSEACATDIIDLRYDAGYELLHVLGKAPSRPTSRCRFRCCVRSGTPSTAAPPARSCAREAARGWTAPVPAGHSPGSRTPPASSGRSVGTACAASSAPPDWSSASASATCSTRCATPTRAPPCARTWPRPTSTATPPAVAAYLAGMSTG